jgi:hypothetical protein
MRKRRPPMTELPHLLSAVAETAVALREAEDVAEQARQRFYAALRAAHEGGASYALLGEVSGLSRQWVAKIIAEN